MITDMVHDTSALTGWTTVYCALPVFLSSALNPWVYGYRNSEVRGAVRRVLEQLLGCLGATSPQYTCPDLLTVPGDQVHLCHHYSERQMYPPRC